VRRSARQTPTPSPSKMSFGVPPGRRPPPFAVGALVGCGVGAVFTSLTYGAPPPFLVRGQDERQALPGRGKGARGGGGSQGKSAKSDFHGDGLSSHPALTHGIPGVWSGGEAVEGVRVWNQGMVTCYDARTRNPRWVAERITKGSVSGESKRKDEFVEDLSIPGRFRARLADYKRSGFDRGHLAPAADFKHSNRAMADTFSLANISPQVGVGFNRDYWARLEKYVRDLVQSHDEVTVVTGPLWVPVRDKDGAWRVTYGMIGGADSPSRMVAIPTHFFKAVLAESRRNSRRTISVACFAVPNASIDAETPLERFAVPLHLVEEMAGLPLFPKTLSEHSTLRAEYDRKELAAVMHDQRFVLPMPKSRGEQSAHPYPDEYGSLIAKPDPTWKVRHLCDPQTGGCTLPPRKFWEEAKTGNAFDMDGVPSKSGKKAQHVASAGPK